MCERRERVEDAWSRAIGAVIVMMFVTGIVVSVLSVKMRWMTVAAFSRGHHVSLLTLASPDAAVQYEDFCRGLGDVAGNERKTPKPNGISKHRP